MKNIIYGKNMKPAVLCAAVMAVSALMLDGCAAGTAAPAVQIPDVIKVQDAGAASDVITVTGCETVKVVPDMAEICYAVRTEASTAEECQNRNKENLDKTIEALKSLGIAETSIQTADFDLNPRYDWSSNRQQLIGYEMTTTLTVSDIPIDDAGKILSESVTSGVNEIRSVSYFSSRYDESYAEALKGAMAMAESKAAAIAQAAGKSLVGITNVEEYNYRPDTRYTAGAGVRNYSAAKMESAMDGMAVMPGQVSVEAQVSVTCRME